MNENNDKKEVTGTNQPTTNINKTSNTSNANIRKKLMRVMLIIIGILVVILIIILIMGIFNGRSKSYEEIESIMKEAATDYYEVQSGLLPEDEGETVTVNADALANGDYMKPLSELRKGEECSGRVEVRRVDGKLIYTPYLDCGENYTSKELYKAILEQGIVSSGEGLYDLNGEKVYRGEDVNNYVKLDHNIFRIVKVTAENKVLLILNETNSNISSDFDDRYNSDRNFNSGFNDYRVSRINEYLDSLYNNTIEDITFLSNGDKEKLVGFNLCLGKRNEGETNNSNAVECSDVLENQMIGLLTTSDYMNASLDTNCRATTDKSCQNYNYLKLKNIDWWLITANAANSYEAYAVRSNGTIDLFTTSATKKIRPTIMINNNIMIKSGDGSISNPFVLK